MEEGLRDGDISSARLSEMCEMSEKHFRTLFKRRYGTTPAQYAIDLRMRDAARLLMEGNFAVSEVAEMVGIHDVYYFSKIFKKRFSVSPSSFKKRS
jgi:AraC-like DNA-binding protein